MRIFVKVKINKNKEGVEKLLMDDYIVWTKEPAKENRANFDIIRQLSDYFGIPKSGVILKRGATSKNKIFEIIK